MTSLLRSKPARTLSMTVVAVAASLLLPFLIHLLPVGNGAPLGAVLLPIFYAPFLAAVFLGQVARLSAAALTPVLNHALTGMPPLGLTMVITTELLLFVVFVLLARRRWKSNPLLAPLAYVAARVVTFSMLMLFSLGPGGSWIALAASLLTALSSIAVLLVLNLVVTRVQKDRRQI